VIPPRLLPHEVTVTAPGTTSDGYGEPSPDWDTPGVRTITARMQQVGAREVSDGRSGQVGDWRMQTNDLTLAADERITWKGITFEVVGAPAFPADGTGSPHHCEAQLRVVTG
jgi:hypothetical protein